MMPYVSNADRERARWMTLREAVEHIEEVEHRGFRAAWDQLRAAIGDQKVLVRWANVSLDLSSIDEGRYIEEDDVPPRERWFWKSARAIFTGDGRILDDPARHGKSARLKLIREGKICYRPVLVRRDAVEQIWPITTRSSEPEQATMDQIGDAEQSTGHSAHRLFRSSTDEKIREEARKVYADPANNRPNVNEADQLIRLKLRDVRSDRVMEILRELEFAKQRRKAGERRKPGKRPKSCFPESKFGKIGKSFLQI
jgi:hypothetical protein